MYEQEMNGMRGQYMWGHDDLGMMGGGGGMMMGGFLGGGGLDGDDDDDMGFHNMWSNPETSFHQSLYRYQQMMKPKEQRDREKEELKRSEEHFNKMM